MGRADGASFGLAPDWRGKDTPLSSCRDRRSPFQLVKTQIPEDLKADLPPSKWGKILSATPVVLAVVSTLLAGLASSALAAIAVTMRLSVSPPRVGVPFFEVRHAVATSVSPTPIGFRGCSYEVVRLHRYG